MYIRIHVYPYTCIRIYMYTDEENYKNQVYLPDNFVDN